MKVLAVLSMVTLLLGCTTAQPTDVPAKVTPRPGRGCDANAIQDLVGKPADANQAEAQRRAGASDTRRYESGSAVTMDHRADRLNIEIDSAGMIAKLSCG